ncbi:MAG: S8 family serine peptidase, partial [Candidatus Marinimicrobia bacterium]|nr:S8 family serine peptidase [Candidatus Neomarinimicrobiota bacterium]
YPGSLSDVIAVGASNMYGERKSKTTSDGEVWWGSNYGSGVDVVAPGVSIYTTDRQGLAGYNVILWWNYYDSFGGTSAAAPHVAGIASLILSINSSLTVQQVRNAIEGSCEKFGTYTYTLGSGEQSGLTWNNQVGYGRVNAYEALKYTLENYGGTLTQNIELGTGMSLDFTSNTVVNLNNKSITTSGGSITIANGAEINPYFCIKNGSTVKALYPTFASALSEVNSGETIEIEDNITLANTITIPAGVTLKLISNARIELTNCYLFFGTGAEIIPNISLNSSSTSYVFGYHSDLNDALDYCTTGKAVEVRDTYTSSVDVTIGSGEALKPQSGSELKFASDKYLYVNSGGNLTATGATFTNTSGTWGGIKYQSGSSGSLYNCNINNASYGIHITNANPLIQLNTIENCSTGLYVYNAYPRILSNSIIDSRVYLNACSSEFSDNYITGETETANPPLCSIYIYNSSPFFWYNTIDIEEVFSIVAYNSSLEFGLSGEDPPECGGYNALDNQSGGDGILHATNGSDIYLGLGDEEELYDYGYNTILGGSCPLWTDGTSYIDAQWCYWENGDPAPNCYGNVETDYELEEDPDAGSSLGKSLSSSEVVTENQSTYEDSLFSGALQMIRDKEYGLALTTFEQIIIDYEDSKYAYRAINLSLKLCRNQQVADTEEWLDKISKSINNDDLAGMIDLKKVSNYQKKGKIDKAIALSEKIPNIRKNKKYGVASLFNLFNFYHKDKENLEMAKLYLDELKANYPDNDLTYIARMDMNEKISYNKLEKDLSSEALLEEEEIIIPETYAFNPAYPNPFNPSTTLEYALPVQSKVECNIYDVSGNMVKEYGFNQNAGTYLIVWDGSNVSSGIYLIRFVAEAEDGSNTFVDYQKVTLLK